MDRSLFLARLMGLTFVAIALGILITVGITKTWSATLADHPGAATARGHRTAVGISQEIRDKLIGLHASFLVASELAHFSFSFVSFSVSLATWRPAPLSYHVNHIERGAFTQPGYSAFTQPGYCVASSGGGSIL